MRKEEGHYTIKVVDKLPKRGNSNWLYSLRKDNLSVFYFWTLNNNYEKVDLADSISAESTSIQAGTNITITGTGTSTDPYIIDSLPVPVYTLDIDANSIRLLSDGTVVSTEDLSLYLDDTNLARLVNGTLDSNTKIATFIRDDSSSFDIDLSGLLSDSSPTGSFAVVGIGAITHTPEIGSYDKYFNDIDQVLALAADSNVQKAGFTIYLRDSGTYTVNNSVTLRNINIESTESVILKTTNPLTIRGYGRINIPFGTIQVTRDGGYTFEDDIDITANTIEMVDEGAAGTNRFIFLTNSSTTRSTPVKMHLYTNLFNIDMSVGQSPIPMFGMVADNVDLTINKINFNNNAANSSPVIFSGRGRRTRNAKVYHKYTIGEIDSTSSIGGFNLFSLGNGSTDVAISQMIDPGVYDINLGGEIIDPNSNRFTLFNCAAGTFNVHMNNLKLSSTRAQLYQSRPGEGRFHRFFFTGSIETDSSVFPLIETATQSFSDSEILESSLTFQGRAQLNNGGANMAFVALRCYKAPNGDQGVPVIIKDSFIDSVGNADIIKILDISTSGRENLNTLLTLKGENQFLFGGTQNTPINFQLNANALNSVNFNVNLGKLIHNATNADYTDGRAFKSFNNQFTHEI